MEADALQRPLRSRFRARLMPGVGRSVRHPPGRTVWLADQRIM